MTQGSKGVVEVGPDGKNVLYTPDPNFIGFDQFTYTITDTENSTDTATVTVEVLNQGEPPLAKNDAQTVLEDSPPNVIPVLANDSDPDGNTADMRVVAVTQGANGVVAIRAGQLDVTYQPNPNFFGTDTFTYSVRDSANNVSTASVVVTVTGIPDAPDAKNDLATVNEGTTKNTIDVLANDVDPDGDAITVSAVTQGQSGTVAIAADSKSVLYTPNAGFVGSDVFTYTIRDPAGNTDSATVLVTVNDLIGPDFIGTDKDDVFLVRLDPTGKNIQVFNNATGTGTPVFSAPLLTSAPLSFDLKLGNDRLIVDSTNGNPIPTGGISYIGGANDIAGDRLSVMGNGGADRQLRCQRRDEQQRPGDRGWSTDRIGRRRADRCQQPVELHDCHAQPERHVGPQQCCARHGPDRRYERRNHVVGCQPDQRGQHDHRHRGQRWWSGQRLADHHGVWTGPQQPRLADVPVRNRNQHLVGFGRRADYEHDRNGVGQRNLGRDRGSRTSDDQS